MNDLPDLVAVLADFPNSKVPARTFSTPCLERLRRALFLLSQQPKSVDSGDLAGLLGHVVWAASAAGSPQRVRVPLGAPWPTSTQWRNAGLEILSQTDNSILLAPGAAWSPSWLDGSDPLSDVHGGVERRHRDDSPSLGADPCWPRDLGTKFERFTSPGQREALRAAALAPPGSTLAINLPTGSGKSLVAWGPALLGLPNRGVTLVIVPTVALALDQERQVRDVIRSQRLGDPAAPLAWHGELGEDDRRTIKHAIRDGRQTIVFASPEAATTALASSLYSAADEGLLRAFVVDEAHVVAQWGNDFRPDFQAIAGLRRELLRRSPTESRFRTRLLTATLTQESFDTLEILFGPVQSVSAVHLRPEPTYWVSQAADETERIQRVLEAVRRVPRPFLLYVSLRKDAEEWFARLRDDERIRRVACVHGESTDRESIVEAWRQNDLDAIVATSAFGLGMDKGDVRAVVHACVPETVDRLYQEVGRGGRDGFACLSLVVTAPDDFRHATTLNRERIISVERGLERWEAMLTGAAPVSGREDVIRVNLTAKPADVTQDSDANLSWNMRTINVMARSGLIELENDAPPKLDPGTDESTEQFDARAKRAFDEYFSHASIRIRPGHRNRRDWNDKINAERRRTGVAKYDQLEALRNLLNGHAEFGETFADTYALTTENEEFCPESTCGGCPKCRDGGQSSISYIPPQPNPPKFSWSVHPRLRNALRMSSDQTFVMVAYDRVGSTPRERRRWRDLVLREFFPRLAQWGIRDFAVGPAWRRQNAYHELSRYAPEAYVLHSNLDEPIVSWPVPRVTLIDPSDGIEVLPRWLFHMGKVNVVVAPTDVRDPDRPSDHYKDRNPVLSFSMVLDELKR